MPQPDPKVVQLTEVLKERFFAFLPNLNRPGWNDPQVEQNKLTRSLAAFAIAKLADVDNSIAAATVIDDFDDNGIDAVFFDRPGNRLFLVQSKFKADGGAPDQGEMKKFADGIRDLLNQQYNRFNDAFQQKLTEVEDALEQTHLKVVAVVAWTGNTLAAHAQRDVDDLRAELNQHHPDRLSVVLLTIDRAHGLLISEHVHAPITVTLTLENWYPVRSPLRAFYGQISVAQLAALYEQHAKALFERNIRYYMGSSGVNDAIATTLRDEPAYLFYLNNGLTAICTRITPKPTAKPDKGEFEVEGFSIVNGAQTVGSIAGLARTMNLTDSVGRVLITLVELAQAPADFGTRVTYARNFQNQVRLVDFAALDKNQVRLQRELAISGITYHIKPSVEAERRDDNTFKLEEAAVALACFSGKTEIAVAVKKEIGKVLDRKGTIYPELFKDNTSAVSVCRAVRAYRFLDAILTSNEIGREKLFYRHLRYFILHILARKSSVLRNPDLNIENDKTTLSRELNDFATLIYNEVLRFPSAKGYLALSRNVTDAVQLSRQVMASIAAREQAASVAPNPPTQAPTAVSPTPPPSATT